MHSIQNKAPVPTDISSSYTILGECMALWGEPNEYSIQCHVCIFMHCVQIAS